MKDTIVLLGEVPASELQIIEASALAYKLNTKVVAKIEMDIFGDEAPKGFLSFLPARRDILLDCFSRLGVGGLSETPFFQKVDNGQTSDSLKDFPIFGIFSLPLSEVSVRNMLNIITHHERIIEQNRQLIGEIIKYKHQKNQLIKIGTALSSQNDLKKLLELILSEIREMVNADAGTVYVRGKTVSDGTFTNFLYFAVSQNDSISDIGRKTKIMPIPMDHNTIAGFVALNGEPLNIGDTESIDDSAPYKVPRILYEQKFNYRVKSILTVPMKNLSGDVVGVLQLINKKPDKAMSFTDPNIVEQQALPFSHSDIDSVLSIASQAAVSLERAQLYESIQRLFEGFLNSSIAAIDERDRVTSGHSRRVMGYALAFADAVNEQTEGPFADVYFSEDRKRQFKFAALLHDIGKIGVPEAILTKETKLPKGHMIALMARIEYIKLALSVNIFEESMPWVSEKELDDDWNFIQKINISGYLSEEEFEKLKKLRDKYYFTPDGAKKEFISEREWELLSIRAGNLSEKERKLINSHAVATRRILSKIPWTKELKLIPEIACHHHEKLDGSGYPDGLKGDEILLESRILAVIDIYEALVAQDRPYKPAVPPEKAIQILQKEAEANHLDSDVVRLFISKGIYKIFMDEIQKEKNGTTTTQHLSCR